MHGSVAPQIRTRRLLLRRPRARRARGLGRHPQLSGAQLHARDARGELAIFYHSNAKPPGVAGICKIVETAEPDPTQFDPTSNYYDAASKPEDPRWDWVTVAPVRALPFVSLDELRTLPELANCRLLAKGNRLSVFPLTDAEFDTIVAFAEADWR